MLRVVSLLAIAAVFWYTVNIARVTWANGHKGGAFAVGFLALLALVVPAGLLFWEH